MKKYILGALFSVTVLAFSSFVFINRADDNASFKQEFLSLINKTR